MGENNEIVVEQPIVPADQNIVATQNEGLMENDPFQEKVSAPAVPDQKETGAVVEEPQPIVEQQIALDVNVEEVFEGGTTKEDEITKIVSDTMGNTPKQPEITITEPTIDVAPTIEQPVVETPAVAIPAPEIPVAEPVPTEQPAQEPVITLEPGPITESPVIEEPVVETTPVVEQTPVVEAPAVEAPIVPEAPIMPEIPIVPEAPVVEQPTTEPVITLEPGPLPEQPSETPTETPVTEEVPQEPVITLEPGPITESPVIEEPAVAPTPSVEETPVAEAVPTEQPVVEVPATEQPTQEPVITLEPGPIQETTNPFDGIVPAPEATPAVEEIAQPADFQQADFQQADSAPIIELTPGPIAETPVVEAPVDTQNTETPVVEAPVSETPVEFSQPSAAPEFSITAAPAMEIPEITNTEVVTPEVSAETPVIEPTPEIQPEEPVLDPVADFAAAPTSGAPTTEGSLTLEQVQNEIANQQLASDPNNTSVMVPASSEPQSIIPVPVTAPVTHEEPKIEQTTEAENVEKTIVLQSSPLGKVQPVAPIINKDEEEATPVEKEEEEPVEEETTEPEEPIVPVVDEEPKEIKKKINIGDIDDIAIKALEEEYKDVEVEENPNKKKLAVEKTLYIEIDETESPKQSRNSMRKIITGEEKFKSNKKSTEQQPEEPLVKFCSSCGNIVKKDDIVCSQCGDPIE